MGQFVYIQLKTKDDKEIIALNEVLESMKVKHHFITNKMNEDWIHDINAGDEAFAWMVKDGHTMTIKELHEQFEYETTVGLLSFDIAFGRTTQAQAKKYAKFILKHHNSIEFVKGGDELVSRYKLTNMEINYINALNKPTEELELLPVEEQHIPDLQGGLLLCKSWSPSPFWVIFGNVDKPTFLKSKKYKDDLYNSIYRDKKGLAYLLIPTMPMDNKQVEFVEEVYTTAWSLGLREDFALFIPYIYGLDITNYKECSEDYKQTYKPEELEEKFWQIFKATNSTFPYGSYLGFTWSDIKKRYKPVGEGTTILNAKCSVLTCLVFAMGAKKAAELMSKLMNKHYSEFEFKF